MANYKIKTRFQGVGFVAVPNYVAQSSKVGADALGVLTYLASLPDEWNVRVADIMARFNFGKDRWQRIAKELRDMGAFERQEIRDASGRITGWDMAVQWPSPEYCQPQERENPVSGENHQERENPAAGLPAKKMRKTRKSERDFPAPYKEERKNTKRGTVPKKHAVRASDGSFAPLPYEGAGAGTSPVGDKTPTVSKGVKTRDIGLEKPEANAGDITPSQAVAIVESLSPFKRSSLREGSSFLHDGTHYASNGAAFAKLADALAFVERGQA